MSTLALIGSSFLDEKAVEYNGVDQYSFRDDPSFKGDLQGAFSFWFRIPAVLAANGQIPLISMGVRDVANDSALHIGARRATATGTDTYVSMQIRPTNGATTSGYSGTTTALAANTWYHCVVSYNGVTWAITIDNVAQTVTAWVGAGILLPQGWLGNVSGAQHRLQMGCTYVAGAASAYGASTLDEVTYINRPPTNPEITALYNGGMPGNPHRILSLVPDIKMWIRGGDSRDTGAMMFDEIGANDFTNVLMTGSNYVNV